MPRTSRAASFRPAVESLERRWVPATLTPTTFADGGLGSGSLRDAVLQFNADTGTDDDIIQLEAGTYALTIQNVGGRHETEGLTGDLNLTQTSHRWIIQGVGASTIIDASQLQDRVFQIVNPGAQVVFQDLAIQGGTAQDDGTDGAVAGTTDTLGGGILNNGGDLTLDHVVVQNNVAQGGDAAMLAASGHNALGGGIYSTGGALTLTGATLANNQASGGRGGDHNGFYPPAGDGGSASGGGLYATGGFLDISDSVVASNRATGGQGGDGSFPSSSGNGGTGGSSLGGGLYVNSSALTISTSTIATNQGTGGSAGAFGHPGLAEAGGLFNRGTLTVSNSTLSANSANAGGGAGIENYGYGGGIDNTGTLTVSNSTLSGNFTSSSFAGVGGGIHNTGTLTVSNSTLSGNSASGAYFGEGGGIHNTGTLTVSNSILSGNSAGTGYGGGIATDRNTIYDSDTVTVGDSTLSGNFADGGGGIYNNSGMLTVSNSTLSGNSAGYNGGGILTGGSRPVTLTNVTLTANRANTGGHGSRGGGLSAGGSPILHNTLIAGNINGATGTTRDDISAALDPSGDYNLIGDGTGMTGLSDGVNGNQVGSASAPIDPLLGPLQDNGGPTPTHALLPGSPALNAGDPAQVGTPDQRGVLRTGGVNIGAYQASASAFLLSAPDTVQPGVPFDVTVTAVDPFGQLAVGYTGTVTFSTSDPDPGVVLPADYTFTPDDSGSHTFSDTGLGETTLLTPGDQTLTVTDTADNTITGSVIITVGSTAPAAGSHGQGQPPQPGRLPGSTPQANKLPHPELVAADQWFASLNKWDSGFTLSPPMHHARAGTDWWTFDPWWGGEPLFS